MFISFLVVLFLIFSPLFTVGGKKVNGLIWADEMFNTLSKGSSYFIPKVTKSNEKFMGHMFSVTLNMSKADDKPGQGEERANRSAALFTVNEGIAKAELKGNELKLEGDLGKVLATAIRDSESMYRNDADKMKALYATAMKTDDMKQMFRQWYNVLDRMNKTFVREKKPAEAKICADVMKKAVEAAYNYYGVEPVKVKDKLGIMTFLLVFYVAYTLWWGFAIFFLFEGIGLSMTKAKVRKEV
jgi:hypothetical protein